MDLDRDLPYTHRTLSESDHTTSMVSRCYPSITGCRLIANLREVRENPFTSLVTF